MNSDIWYYTAIRLIGYLTFLGKLAIQGKFCSVCELTRIISSIHSSSVNGSIPSADCIRTHINLISPVFNIGKQEDASEFIITLLHHLTCCLPSHLSMSSITYLKTTIIDQIFSIKLLSSGHCPACLYEFQNEEVINMLLVEMNNLFSLTDALAHFAGQEVVNGFICPSCNACVQLNKHITINELSPILIINFKRYAASFDSTSKLLQQVNYDEVLNLSPYMTFHFLNIDKRRESGKSSNKILYKLYAVINHVGRDLNVGHYYACIRSFNDLWVLVDDINCRSILLDDILNHPDAFILFYAKLPDAPESTDILHQQLPEPLMSSATEKNTLFHSSKLISPVRS